MQDNIVEVLDVGKNIRDVSVLENVSLTVKQGECTGIIGENGSGKTTLLRLMTGLVARTTGKIKLFGHDPSQDPISALASVRSLIGIPAYYPHITAFDNMRLFSTSEGENGSDRIMAALEEVGLHEEKDKKVGVFSRGMLQRLGIAFTLIENPLLYIFDEPTQGVDEVWIEKLKEIIASRQKTGKTFIITSHNFDFISSLCETVLILDQGKSLYKGELKKVAEFPYYFLLRGTPEQTILDTVNNLEYVHKILSTGGGFELTMRKEYSSDLIKLLVEKGCRIDEHAFIRYSTSDLVQHLLDKSKSPVYS
ncbi:MAG: ABC transporter ATP-binding protein [Nitrospinota bacterium]|nr:ABC transporter ATP-binding protein [Nitrospinota bacterium]